MCSSGAMRTKSILSLSSFWISVVLLLVYLQMLTSLVFFAGVLVVSDEVLISPFRFCRARQQGELSCTGPSGSLLSGDESGLNIDILTALVTLGLYVPVALVAFALLAMLLATCAKDKGVLWFSMICQAVSSFLTLAGIIAFVELYRSHFSWTDLTLGFYVCVSVQLELVITTVLTTVLGWSLTSDWE